MSENTFVKKNNLRKGTKEKVKQTKKGSRSSMGHLSRKAYETYRISKNQFWKLNKSPERLYGIVIPSVLG